MNLKYIIFVEILDLITDIRSNISMNILRHRAHSLRKQVRKKTKCTKCLKRSLPCSDDTLQNCKRRLISFALSSLCRHSHYFRNTMAAVYTDIQYQLTSTLQHCNNHLMVYQWNS